VVDDRDGEVGDAAGVLVQVRLGTGSPVALGLVAAARIA
jgi:hypothetical protein